MLVSARLVRSFAASIALTSVALAGCGDASRQEGLTRAARTMVVVRVPASAAAAAEPPAARATPSSFASPGSQSRRPSGPGAAAAVKPSGDGKALTVNRLVLATQVEKASREPRGVGSSFKKGEFDKLYAFVELANPGDEAQVLVSFEPPSQEPARGNVRLDVGTSHRWRTWASSSAVNERGEWSAVVTAPDGRELAREKFEIL